MMKGNANSQVTVEYLGWNHSQLASQAQGKLEPVVLPGFSGSSAKTHSSTMARQVIVSTQCTC